MLIASQLLVWPNKVDGWTNFTRIAWLGLVRIWDAQAGTSILTLGQEIVDPVDELEQQREILDARYVCELRACKTLINYFLLSLSLHTPNLYSENLKSNQAQYKMES